MRLDDARESDNVEDRRGLGGSRGFRPGGVGGLGIGGLLVLLAVSYFLGVDPTQLLQDSGVSSGGRPTSEAPAEPSGSDPTAVFVKKVLADTEDTWSAIFERSGQRYSKPVLVLFSDAVNSACGQAAAATGPFYCPSDQKVYLDLSFFRELDQRFGAPGDFAQAYVIAHEIGHHVQNLTGNLSNGGGLSRNRANAQSVRQELQADCLAGVWGHEAAARHRVEPGDAEEGLTAAAAIGDDRLQRESQGRVVPDSFTHGSSADRVAALQRGLQSGNASTCGLGR
jgi:predicted metalloprotease